MRREHDYDAGVRALIIEDDECMRALLAAMVRDLAGSDLAEPDAVVATLALADLGGSALWLRSEPGEDATLAEALAAAVAQGMA